MTLNIPAQLTLEQINALDTHETAIIFTKPGCVQCNATKKKFDQLNLKYEMVDVTRDEKVYGALVEEGHLQMPVVRAAGETWTGFRPDLVSALVNA